MKQNKFYKTYLNNLFLIIFALSSPACLALDETSIQAHLSSGWYPQDEKTLHEKLVDLEQESEKLYPTKLQNVRAMIVPHAGYDYSGTVAASCFKLLQHQTHQKIDRVIVLAPSHNLSFQGIAVPDHAKGYQIATGHIKFDIKIMKKLTANLPFISSKKLTPEPFETEHSFEIQCPLIHKYINHKIPIIPLLVGYLDEDAIKNAAQILQQFITPQTLIIVSSDFTHYGQRFNFMPFGPTDQAKFAIRSLDFKIIEQLFQPSLQGFLNSIKSTQATVCGKYPIALLLALLENTSLGPVTPHLVAYTTSQKTGEILESSVSYAGIAYADDHSVTLFEQQSLLTYAKDLLLASFSTDIQENLLLPLITPFMKEKYGTFISWYGPHHTLRGCIGTTQANNSLIDNVRIYAKQAAFYDSRFTSITKDEAPFVTPTISILTPFQKIKSYQDIILGEHGILLQCGTHQAVFLPQVAIEQGWDLTTTLQQLSLKAGLSKNAWQDKNCTFEICTGYEIK